MNKKGEKYENQLEVIYNFINCKYLWNNSCISLHFNNTRKSASKLTCTFIRTFNWSNHTRYSYVCHCYLYWPLPCKKVGLGLPILEGWLEGREVKSYLKSILGISIGLGILAGILIIGLDYLFSFAGVTINVAQAVQ